MFQKFEGLMAEDGVVVAVAILAFSIVIAVIISAAVCLLAPTDQD